MKVKKALLIILLTIAIMMSSITIVYADSLTVGVRTDATKYKRGDTVTVTVSLSNIDSTNGIYGLSGQLSYDTEVFEPLTADATGNTTSIVPAANSEWSNVTFNSTSNEFSILTTRPAKNSLAIMVISFKVKDDAKLGDTIIQLKELIASNGEEDIETSPAATSVTIAEESAAPQPSPEPSTQPIIQPSASPTTKPTTVVTKTPSTTNGKLPQTGVDNFIVPVVVGAVMISVGTFIVYIRYKDVK